MTIFETKSHFIIYKTFFMGLTKDELKQIEKEAKAKGFSWNSDGSKMTNSNGDTVKPSSSGGSVKLNGSHYNSVPDYKKSKQHR